AGAVLQPAGTFRAIAGQPFSRGPDRNSALPGQAGHRLTPQGSRHQLLSTVRRQSGILVHVHPGLLSRVSNDLAATTFPRSAWVNNLLLHHSEDGQDVSLVALGARGPLRLRAGG